MTITDPDKSATPEPVVLIRYANQCGALVLVTDQPGRGSLALRYLAKCGGCLDENGPHSTVDRPRTWASGHARECRALPQPDAEQQ